MNLNKYLDIAPEVQQALADGRPVVALESTIISHGMPYPKNVETALLVEQTLRDNGAVPATIAILGGRLKAGLSKEEIRAIAEEQGLVSARRRDSQDICFVPDGDYAAFLCHHTGRTYSPGPFCDPEGRVLGVHEGIIHYTVGQRRGLKVSSNQGRLYVKELCPQENRVILSDNQALFHRGLTGKELNLIPTERLDRPIRVQARIRYRMTPQPAWLEQTGPDTCRVTFDQPQRAITPGQSVVFYDGPLVVGGAVILKEED